jgi:riboflavin synthase alpha subunit
MRRPAKRYVTEAIRHSLAIGAGADRRIISIICPIRWGRLVFTGLVEELGVVQALERSLANATMTILARRVIKGMSVGDSVTVNGVCLTVVRLVDHGFAVEVSPETLRVTTLGGLVAGDGVNLERALRLGDRLGGHLVSGHVGPWAAWSGACRRATRSF